MYKWSIVQILFEKKACDKSQSAF